MTKANVKCSQCWSGCNVIWKTVPQLQASRNKWSFANCDKTRRTDSKLVRSWRPKSSPRRHVSNACQCGSADRTGTEAQSREELGRRWPTSLN